MRELSIDIETYSSKDLTKAGVYAYTDAPDFQILLFAYAFDDEKVRIVDIASGEKLPTEIMYALTDKNIRKTAYNASFEMTCIAKYFNLILPPEQWQCTMICVAELGLPHSLKQAAEALGLSEQKDRAGRACIDYFSKPCEPAKENGGRERNLPENNIEKWAFFKAYCMQDVIVEREIKRKLSHLPLARSEQRLWEYDRRIADRGVRIDVAMVRNAIRISGEHKAKCTELAARLTGLENPNSATQLKNWICERTGERLEKIDKKAVTRLLESTSDSLVKQVLTLRLQMAKTSTKKYEAMINSVCPDGRIRGILQFYGANRTGRWSGKMVQVQNLPQNHLKDLALAKRLVCDGDYELFEMLYGDVSDTLSQLIRTALIPSDGRRFIVSDFSAIEARIIAYLAGEEWRQEVFRNGGDIYCASASQMFHVPVEKHGVNGHLRQKGKIAELALGYGGSTGALKAMGALEMGLAEEELRPLVDSWRDSNPQITALWKEVERAAISAVKDKPTQLKCGILFYKKSGILFVKLPSGRSIAYTMPRLQKNRFGRETLTYMGTKQRRDTWERIETFGGKLTENIVQAFARDCLAESIIRLEDRGFEINFHVHDEVILDVPVGVSSAKEIADIMGEPIPWAKGLLLKAEAYETDFYMKG